MNAKRRYQGKPRGVRWPLVVVIVILHLLALYGLSRALAPDFTASVEREVVDAFTVTITAPPDPEPDTPPEPDEGAAARAAGATCWWSPTTACWTCSSSARA